ncbi:MAG: PKD domain-containing protein, partial [Thermoplasmata archaeon]
MIFDASNSTDPDGDALIYEWTTNDPSHSPKTGKNVSFVFKTPGVYTATLKVTDAFGATSTTSINVEIKASDGSSGGKNEGTSLGTIML